MGRTHKYVETHFHGNWYTKGSISKITNVYISLLMKHKIGVKMCRISFYKSWCMVQNN